MQNIELSNHQTTMSSENQTIKPSDHQIINPPLFPNTDVPLACLFIHLEHGYTISQFLQDFPSVSKEQVQRLLELTVEIFKRPSVHSLSAAARD